jgi:hypothetical protein
MSSCLLLVCGQAFLCVGREGLVTGRGVLVVCVLAMVCRVFEETTGISTLGQAVRRPMKRMVASCMGYCHEPASLYKAS